MFNLTGINCTLAAIGLDTVRRRGGEDEEPKHKVLTVFKFLIPLDAAPLREAVSADYFPSLAQMEELTRLDGGSVTCALTQKWEAYAVSVHNQPPDKRSAKKAAAFDLTGATVRGKPKLVVKKGSSTVEVQFRDELGGKEMARFAEYLGATVWVDCAPLQTPMPGTGLRHAGTGEPLSEQEQSELESDFDDSDAPADE